jgi:acyl dehydratase
MMEYKLRGKTFDEVNIGDEVVTLGRTITEADVTNFAGVSGDFQPEHMNEEYAKHSPLGGRVAHGLLTLSAATGMVNQMGISEGTTIALLEVKTRFTKPVRFGDTIRAIFKIIDKKETKKPDRGIVTSEVKVVNQRNEVVLESEWVVMLYRKGYPKHPA